jgi:hypothetical protein
MQFCLILCFELLLPLFPFSAFVISNTNSLTHNRRRHHHLQ